MIKNIRRRRLNYFLPSESVETLERMVGKRIAKFKVGVRKMPSAMLEPDGELSRHSSFQDYHGGPFFLTFECGSTIVIYDDDFLGSIVLREIHHDIDEIEFLDCLELQDRLGERIKVRYAIDLATDTWPPCATINAISVYQLPKNYCYKPNGYDLIHECVLSLKFADQTEILFVSQVREMRRPSDVRISKWQWLDEEDAAQLCCIVKVGSE